MRIGILQTDEVRSEWQPEFGDYPAMFHSVLESGNGNQGTLGFSSYDVRKGEYPRHLDECDGYLITGSRDSVYDDHEWIRALGTFVRALDAARKPLVGICFGHQLIAHFLDGETAPAEAGWAVGVHEAEVFEQRPWMTPCQSSFRLVSSHKDQVVTLPRRAALFAGNAFCPYGGYTIDDHIVTFQGHPEFGPAYAAQLMAWRREVLGEECFRLGMASLEQSLDSSLVAAWIINFIDSALTGRAP